MDGVVAEQQTLNYDVVVEREQRDNVVAEKQTLSTATVETRQLNHEVSTTSYAAVEKHDLVLQCPSDNIVLRWPRNTH